MMVLSFSSAEIDAKPRPRICFWIIVIGSDLPAWCSLSDRICRLCARYRIGFSGFVLVIGSDFRLCARYRIGFYMPNASASEGGRIEMLTRMM